MPTVTNVSRRVIHVGDTMLVPGTPTDLSDDLLKHKAVKRLLDAGEIKEGEVEVKSELLEDEGDRPAPPPAQKPAPAPQQKR